MDNPDEAEALSGLFTYTSAYANHSNSGAM